MMLTSRKKKQRFGCLLPYKRQTGTSRPMEGTRVRISHLAGQDVVLTGKYFSPVIEDCGTWLNQN